MAEPHHVVHNIEELRAIAEQAEPGSHLYVVVDPGMPLEDLLQVWESMTAVEGPIELYNLDTVRGKKDGADFIEKKIRHLEELRDDCTGRIGCMNNWVGLMERSLQGHVGPAVPEDHTTVWTLGYPNVFLNVHQIGSGNMDKGELLEDSFEMPYKPERDDTFWGAQKVRERARMDRRSLIKFNIFYLKLKIKVLKAVRSELIKGIKMLKREVLQGRFYLGCSNEVLGSFRDLPLFGGGVLDV